MKDALPLVYSCSGCSSAAQLANHVAVRLHRQGAAEMSCIAGLGGDVKALVRLARRAQEQARPILAIDGCALVCVKSTLARHGVVPTRHLALWEMGVRKRVREDFDATEADAALAAAGRIVAELTRAQPPAASGRLRRTASRPSPIARNIEAAEPAAGHGSAARQAG